MRIYSDRQDLIDRIEWEGGIEDFFLHYGVKLEHLPPEDTELQDAVEKALIAMEPFVEALDHLENLLDLGF